MENKALEIIKTISTYGINGAGPLSSAKELAEEYIKNDYSSNDERVESLIKWETAKGFTSGFITGVGGAITLPVTIPTSLAVSWIIQVRLATAIACIYGHDIKDERVKTMAVMCILGDSIKQIFKEAGIKVSQRIGYKIIEKIPGRILIEINKKVGFRLLTKAGETGIVNLIKFVPILGGIAGGLIDGTACRSVGKIAKEVFKK